MSTPAWFASGLWKPLVEDTYSVDDPLEGEIRTFTARRASLGAFELPSGDLVATSLCMEVSSVGDCGGHVRLPPGIWNAWATLVSEVGRRDREEAAIIGDMFLFRRDALACASESMC